MTFKDRSRAYRNDLSFSQRVPDGDAISRNICDHCGLINYENPKIVAGVVAVVVLTDVIVNTIANPQLRRNLITYTES